MKKPYLTNHAEIGDIVTAAEFAYCVCDMEIEWDDKEQRNVAKLYPNKLEVDSYKSKHHPVGFLAYTNRKGKSIDDEVDLGCYDGTRASAEFVVEKTVMDGGGTGHGPGDIYPDGWHVFARRLSDDGIYNPKGEVVEFYQSGCFNCMVEQVQVVGKMKMKFERGQR